MARPPRAPSSTPGRFLVERYRPGLTIEGLRAGEAAIRRACLEVTREGHPVRYLGSTFVPDEEAVLAVFEAEAVAWVEEADRRAGQRHDRVASVVDRRGSEQSDGQVRTGRPRGRRNEHT